MKDSVQIKEFKQGVKDWTLTFPDILKLIKKKNPVVMDVGGSTGETLLALHELGITTSFLIEPSWEYNGKKFQRLLKISPASLKKKGITLMPICGYSEDVPYHLPDLIIKTYNPFVDWDHVLKKSKAKWILSDNQWLTPKDLKKLEIVKTFNLHGRSPSGIVVSSRNTYVLARRK